MLRENVDGALETRASRSEIVNPQRIKSGDVLDIGITRRVFQYVFEMRQCFSRFVGSQTQDRKIKFLAGFAHDYRRARFVHGLLAFDRSIIGAQLDENTRLTIAAD